MRFVLLSFFIGLLSVPSIAQQEVISFQHYGVADGLSDNNIRCILLAKNGYMWLGTNEGLNRFDGEEFFVYRKERNNANSICGNVITDLLEDADGRLWIATRDGGICRLNPKTGEVFTPKLISDFAPDGMRFIHAIEFDKENRLVVGSDKGLFRSDITCTSFSNIQHQYNQSSYDLQRLGDRLFVSCIARGVVELVADSLTFLSKNTFPYPAHTINSFFEDSQHQLWLACWDNYLHRYDAASNSIESINHTSAIAISYSADEVLTMTEATPGVLWIAMKSGQIWRYAIENKNATQLNISSQETSRLNGKKIYCT